MRRAPIVITGTAIGAAAVMAIPSPGTPQQVALAGNAGATTTGGGTAAPSSGTSSASPTPKTNSPAAATAVLGSLVTNQYGQLRVKLTVKAGRITKVGFTTFTASDGHSVEIDQSAVPILIQETISAQSAQIQGVSGATYTTTAYEQSLQAAIDKAALHA
ncbi:MAG: hypothetical protein QOE17_2258 [Gaiellales bacterium]|jgi:uncharacterized protein with FMN-binding domain|nr:hypothetical protein [Gaiellales bacterium]